MSKKDAYQVPDIHNALDHLAVAKYVATFDLLSGYWQLDLTERTKERSALLYAQRAISVYAYTVWVVWSTLSLL